ncbi:cytochrome b [Oxalobacteraceae bacterium OM1]|nr:cytochrome b [Oxalobacteraceae bacterium OM1]
MRPEQHPLLHSATRIAAGDDRTRYDTFSISLHWLTALLVIVQFVLAVTWGDFPRPTRHLMIVAHMSLGIVLTAVIAIRIVWRLTPGHAVPAATTGWVELASKAVHYLLYAMLAAEAVLGFVLRWSGNESMSFFGLLMTPPMEPFSKPMHRLMGEIHEWNGWAIVILAAGHAAAALYHHYVLRDGVLGRMLPSIRKRGLP